MKNQFIYAFVSLFALGAVISSCSSNDDHSGLGSLAVGFQSKSVDLSGADQQKEIEIAFSESTLQAGTLELSYTTENVLYGEEEDFTTDPSGEEGTLKVPYQEGSQSTSFTLNKLKDALPGEEKSVTFTIIGVEGGDITPQGNTSVKVSFSESASLGSSIKPEVGGPNEPNQVYVSLKSENQTVVKRDAWDLGFYAGEEFRVTLNSSLKMFAGAIEATDIDAVKEEDFADLMPKMALLTSGSDQFVDDPAGDLSKTAIAAVSDQEAENKVYLINLGNKIGTEKPEVGSVAVDQSDPDEPEKGKRGWKKVRILKEGNDYILQYADLNDTNHKEVTIAKDQAYNFTFFSFEEENTVEVEPTKNDWDLNFTTYTNTLDLPGDYGGGKTAYGYSDYIAINNLAGVQVYEVSTDDFNYANFSRADVKESELSSDRTHIGDGWRNVFEQSASDDRFYVLKDAEGNFYKIEFTALVNEDGERGHPAFDYELLTE